MSDKRNADAVGADLLGPNRIAVGIDFSGGKNAAKKIWIAEATRTSDRELQLCRLANGFSFDELRDEIIRQRAADILLDFPLGLAEHTCENLGLSKAASYLDIWEKLGEYETAESFRLSAKAGETGQGSERLHKRHVDRETKTPFAPINLRMFRQTYYGQAKVLLPAKRMGSNVCFLPWDDFDVGANCPRVGEGCPASTLKALKWPSSGYKGNSPDCEASRTSLLRRLKETVPLTLTPENETTIVSDTEGDALDATLLAVAAAHLQDEEFAKGKLFSQTHKTEGFVYLGFGFHDRTEEGSDQGIDKQ